MLARQSANLRKKHWLLTNGLGSYAMGSVDGGCTATDHYLLAAPMRPPLQCASFVRMIAAQVFWQGRWSVLHAQVPTVDAQEAIPLELTFRFDWSEGMPVFIYSLRGYSIVERLWMPKDFHGIFIRYENIGGEGGVPLRLTPFVEIRDLQNQNLLAEAYNIQKTHGGICLYADPNDKPWMIAAQPAGKNHAVNVWRTIELYNEPLARWQSHEVYLPLTFEFVLHPSAPVTLLLAYDGPPSWDGEAAFQQEVQRQAKLAVPLGPIPIAGLERVAQRSQQFLIRRPTAFSLDNATILAGYPNWTDHGREAMIALPGLLLRRGEFEVAKQIFNLYFKHMDQGLIPYAFSPRPENPNYASIDATLWLFVAIYEYWRASQDHDFIASVYATLLDILHAHLSSTTPGIKYDGARGMILPNDFSSPMTWMNGRSGSWLATPRPERAVEVQALWYNALMAMVEFSRVLEKQAGEKKCSELAERAGKHLREKFWHESAGYLYDTVSERVLPPEKRTPFQQTDLFGEADGAIRPNAVVAAGLPFMCFTPAQTTAIVTVAVEKLLTPFGLRTLAPDHPAYCGKCAGSPRQISSAVHNGTVHPWLVATFVRAFLRAHEDGKLLLLEKFSPLFDSTFHPCEGAIAQMYDGDAPHHPRGAPAFAASTGAVLQAYAMLKTEA
ncbi:MAG: amylo-alpha-1,6-glucosidase [bacterium]